MLKEIIDIATKNLIGKSNLISSLKHPLEKGVFREFFITEILKPLLPHYYEISSGIIVDCYGNQSPQMDVIIYDMRRFPPLMLRSGAGIIPLDSVMSVIEVKSELAAEDVRTSLKSATKLHPFYDSHLTMAKSSLQSHYPLYAVFAYTSSAKLESEFKRFHKEYCSSNIDSILKEQYSKSHNAVGSELIKLIGVLDKGVWSQATLDGQACSVERRSDELTNMRNFIWFLLSEIETTSASRGNFNIKDWLQLS